MRVAPNALRSAASATFCIFGRESESRANVVLAICRCAACRTDRPPRPRLREDPSEDRRRSLHQHCRARLQWKACLSRPGARIRVRRQAVLRDRAALIRYVKKKGEPHISLWRCGTSARSPTIPKVSDQRKRIPQSAPKARFVGGRSYFTLSVNVFCSSQLSQPAAKIVTL
jgi:hypothetical protein